MNNSYTIDLSLDHGQEELEEFEKADENLIEIRVQCPGSKVMESKGYRVELTMSPDAMLGFGTELIRKAFEMKKSGLGETGGFEHLYPITSESVTENMGVYLTPNSAELLVSAIDFGKVEEAIKKLTEK